MGYTRTHISINGSTEAAEFVSRLNSDGTATKYVIESADGKIRVNARSLLGVIYASAEFADGMYFVNDTSNGEFPGFIDSYRVLAS